MSALFMSLAALLSATQADAPPSPELVQRFIAALPPRQRPLNEIDPDDLGRLLRLNPGGEADLRQILQAHANCIAPPSDASTDRMLRDVATRLGTANVEALVRLYQGPDLVRLGRLAGKADRDSAEAAEFERLLRAYPVEAFREAMQSASASAIFDETLFEAIHACDRARADALARAGLRASD